MSLTDWLFVRRDNAELRETLSKLSRAVDLCVEQRNVERERHLKREDHLVSVITRQAKDYAPAPSSVEPKSLPPLDPSVMSARDEAARIRFIEDALAVNKSEQDGIDAFEEWKHTGTLPYQSETSN